MDSPWAQPHEEEPVRPTKAEPSEPKHPKLQEYIQKMMDAADVIRKEQGRLALGLFDHATTMPDDMEKVQFFIEAQITIRAMSTYICSQQAMGIVLPDLNMGEQPVTEELYQQAVGNFIEVLNSVLRDFYHEALANGLGDKVFNTPSR